MFSWPLFNDATLYFAVLTKKDNKVDTTAKAIGLKQVLPYDLHVLKQIPEQLVQVFGHLIGFLAQKDFKITERRKTFVNSTIIIPKLRWCLGIIPVHTVRMRWYFEWMTQAYFEKKNLECLTYDILITTSVILPTRGRRVKLWAWW